tara:strand:- start:1407 stop:2369 length:963 start_codon:yes stop_codon:yes gene_type:complete
MLATLSLLLISNTSIFAPNQIGNTQLAFIDALVNSVTKGEGALKHTCYQVRHTSEATTFIEQEQCRKAQKEVEFSKRQYPKALSFVSRYERQELNNTTDQLRYLSDSSNFIKDCQTEKNTRAAKTMRYWGTEEVGNWHYTNLKKMGADNYKSILTACESGSWVYTTREDIEGKISDIAAEIASKNFVTNCNAVASSKNWTKAQQLKNFNTNNDLLSKKKTIEILSNQVDGANDSIAGIDSTLLNSRNKQIKRSTSFCQAAIALGEKALADQEREKARALAAKREAERQYQRAKEAQRKAAAAEAARQQDIQNANEGVILD